jgi:hypothetical protein
MRSVPAQVGSPLLLKHERLKLTKPQTTFRCQEYPHLD